MIAFVISSQNIIDPLTKGLTRDLMNKTLSRMSLKPIQINHQRWKLNSILNTMSSLVFNKSKYTINIIVAL